MAINQRYLQMEEVLQSMNPAFITVQGDIVKRTNTILLGTLHAIIDTMKEVSSLFDELYETNFYGGSFYDGVKVGKPNEFDLDLQLKLPKLVGVEVVPSDKDGFVCLRLAQWDQFRRNSSEYMRYKDLENFKDSSNYLRQDKVLQWMESIVDKALNRLCKQNPQTNETIWLSTEKHGPAITLKISYQNIKFDVDLVAVIKMTDVQWPSPPFRQSTYKKINKRSYFAVPKSPNALSLHYDKSKYWRLSFQSQEKKLIQGLNSVKPALRLLKKLRDSNGHNIPSYYLKTIFLWEIESFKKNRSFWNQPLSTVFMHMLKRYRDYLSKGDIPYFWNKNENLLLANIDAITVENIKNFITGMINKINREIDSDEYIAARYILTEEELEDLINETFTPEDEEEENTHNIFT